MSHTTWILVTDTGQAKIFKAIKTKLFDKNADSKDLTLIQEITHPESRKRDQDFVTDKSGKFGSAAFESPTDPKHHENDRFALEITKILAQAHHQNEYYDLILIAPPAFMGLIHKHLDHEVKKIVCKEIEKDYTRIAIKELIAHLRDNL